MRSKIQQRGNRRISRRSRISRRRKLQGGRPVNKEAIKEALKQKSINLDEPIEILNALSRWCFRGNESFIMIKKSLIVVKEALKTIIDLLDKEPLDKAAIKRGLAFVIPNYLDTPLNQIDELTKICPNDAKAIVEVKKVMWLTKLSLDGNGGLIELIDKL